MASPSESRSIGLALEWVAKITTVGIIMALPAAVGQYADRQWGTSFWGLMGLVFGVVAGIWQLLRMVQTPPAAKD